MHSNALLYSLYANIFVLFAKKRRQQQQTATKFKHLAIQTSAPLELATCLAALPCTPPFIFWRKYKERSAFTTQKAIGQIEVRI